MPLTAKGESLLEKFKEQYGEAEGERIFYASKQAGTIEGVDAMPKRRKTQAYDPRGREAGSYEEEDSSQLTLEEDGSQLVLPLVTIIDIASTSQIMHDAIDMADAKMDFTTEGYLKAQPRIARTGIQLYKGDECGRPDVDVVRVYRPESSVFRHDAMHSYSHLPITLEHPGVTVTADNWKKYAIGETGDEVIRDGGSVRVPMMLRDAAAIQLVKDGKRELSVGYGCDLVWGDGFTPDGEPYDAVQHNIRGNHLAIVTRARGGPSLAIGDTTMTKQVMIDGLPCEMTDNSALIVQRAITQLQDQIENFKKKFAKKGEEEEEKEKEDAKRVEDIKVKDALILTLQSQLKDATDPAKLAAMLNDLDQVRARARALMGDAFKIDGKKIEDVRREVVLAKSTVPTAKDWGDAEIAAVFTQLTADVKPRNPINDARTAFAGNSTSHINPKAAAYEEMVRDSENAWRNPS